MKYFTSLILLLIFGASFAFAGPGGKIYKTFTGQVNHGGASRDCIVIQFDEGGEDVQDAWEDFIKDRYDIKLRGGDMLEAIAVKLNAVTDKTMDLFTQVNESKDGVYTLKIFARLGYDLYLNDVDFPANFKRLEGVVNDFTASYLPKYYRSEIEASEDKLEELIDAKEDVLSDISDLKGDMEDNEEEIAELQKENKQLSSQIKDKESTISTHDAAIEKEKANLRTLRSKHEDAKSK